MCCWLVQLGQTDLQLSTGLGQLKPLDLLVDFVRESLTHRGRYRLHRLLLFEELVDFAAYALLNEFEIRPHISVLKRQDAVHLLLKNLLLLGQSNDLELICFTPHINGRSKVG